MKIVLFILTLSSLCLAPAETPRICVVCQQTLTGSFLLLSSPSFVERQPVCESCSKLEHLCFTCGLPVKMNYLKLEDGRFLCQRDAKIAVTSQEEAERLFSEVKRDVRVFLNGFGVLPDRNVSLLLVDRFQMEIADTIKEPNHD